MASDHGQHDQGETPLERVSRGLLDVFQSELPKLGHAISEVLPQFDDEPAPREGGTLRDAQVTAALAAMGWTAGSVDDAGNDMDQLAAEVVDAVNVVGPNLDTLLAETNRLRVQVEEYRQHILDIDAHATPYGDIPDEPGWVGTYLVTAGALHRALGKIGHTAPNCQAEEDVALLALALEAAQEQKRTAEEKLIEVARRAYAAEEANHQARDAGYREAITALRDDPAYLAWCDANPGYDGRRVWSLSARHGLADYLETVGPRQDAGRPETAPEGPGVDRGTSEARSAASGDEDAACTCPQVETTDHADLHAGRQTFTKGRRDPNCTACRQAAARG